MMTVHVSLLTVLVVRSLVGGSRSGRNDGRSEAATSTIYCLRCYIYIEACCERDERK